MNAGFSDKGLNFLFKLVRFSEEGYKLVIVNKVLLKRDKIFAPAHPVFRLKNSF